MTVPHHATWAALMAVATERRRQDELRDAGRFRFTLADADGLTPTQKLACLIEERGEIARQALALEGLVQEMPNEALLRTELVQLAALVCAWVEALDRELGGGE